ncbi:MAG: Hpt domain-containing protein, partial [Desulfonatronovibrio sp.]
ISTHSLYTNGTEQKDVHKKETQQDEHEIRTKSPDLYEKDSKQSSESPASVKMIFNYKDFMERYDNDLEIAADIMNDFLEDMSGALSRIINGTQSKDEHATDRAAHKLKGSASYTGAEIISQICENIMWSALMKEWDDVQDEIKKLEIESRRFQKKTRSFFSDKGISI